MRNFSFPNIYKLKSKKIMDELFLTAHSKLYYPVLSKFKIFDSTVMNVPFQIGFSVPKRRIRKAVHRNLIKRRMIEATRLNKHILVDQLSKELDPRAIMFIYTSNTIMDYNQIEKAIINQLKHISKVLIK